MIAKTEKRQLYRQLKYKSPENTGLSGLYRGETGIRTLATVTRRQISNLLHYHSGTSPTQKVFHALKTRLQMYFLEYNITTFLKLFLALFFIAPKLFWICYPKVVDIS